MKPCVVEFTKVKLITYLTNDNDGGPLTTFLYNNRDVFVHAYNGLAVYYETLITVNFITFFLITRSNRWLRFSTQA